MKERFHDVQWLDANIGVPASEDGSSDQSNASIPGSSSLPPDEEPGPGVSRERSATPDSDDDLVYELGKVSIMEYAFEGGHLNTFRENYTDQIGLQVALDVYRTHGHYKEVYFVSIYLFVCICIL